MSSLGDGINEFTGASGDSRRLRVLELYSGIGGMHFACRSERTEVVAAIDVNTTANAVYAFNFPSTRLMQRNVQSLSARELDALRPDLLTMSPPCQPFTRQGLQLDSEDPRSSSFLSLLRVLPSLNHPPTYILLENVKGFESSSTCSAFLDTLRECGYHAHRYLLSPTQIGVPNSRLRFYCLAKKNPLRYQDCEPTGCQHDDVKFYSSQPPPNVKTSGTPPPLSEFLQTTDQEDTSACLLPDRVLSRFAMILDIVDEKSTNTCCFTKGYGHYVEGTGSVLLQASRDAMHQVYHGVQPKTIAADDVLEGLRSLRLRYFTPREVARLMCFPDKFSFPPELMARHRYQLLGNSVNVAMIRALLDYLTDDFPRGHRERNDES